MTLPPVITLDGPASVGKTTVAHAIATQFGYLLIDTGAFYRAVALAALRANVPIGDAERLIALAAQLQIEVLPADGSNGVFYRLRLNGEDVTAAICSADVRADRLTSGGCARRTPGLECYVSSACCAASARDHGRTRHRHGCPARRRAQNLP